MTANPVELIGGLTTTANVAKADIVGWAKARVPQVLANAAEINNTTLANQLIVFLKSNGHTYYLDTTDLTTPDDGLSCIISLDGFRFKAQSSIPAPTPTSLGGVFASAAIPTQYVTGLDTSGNLLRARPAATDLSDGVTGTTQVVRANAPVLVMPTLGAAAATSVVFFGSVSRGRGVKTRNHDRGIGLMHRLVEAAVNASVILAAFGLIVVCVVMLVRAWRAG